MSDRSALLINLGTDEAHTIRERAKMDYRNVSHYVLNILMRAVAHDEQLFSRLTRLQGLPTRFPRSVARPRTTMLLRCTTEQAQRIRAAAKRRETTISSFVLHSLQTAWNAEAAARGPVLRKKTN